MEPSTAYGRNQITNDHGLHWWHGYERKNAHSRWSSLIRTRVKAGRQRIQVLRSAYPCHQCYPWLRRSCRAWKSSPHARYS